MKRLLLFDIDGTLLRLGRPSYRAINQTLREVFGPIEKEKFNISFSGKTDRRILRELLTAAAFPINDFDAMFAQFKAAYPANLRRELGLEEGRRHDPLPGIVELLELLRTRQDLCLALVTGNTEPTGWMKVEACGIREHFAFGAFGCEHEERAELVRRAVARAREATGVAFPPEAVYVIGDSPHDIACARDTGSVAVAVCTGVHDQEELARHEPDFLFPALNCSDEVVNVLLPG